MRQHREADEFSYGSTIRACGSAWLQSLLLCNQMLGRAWPWPGTCSHCFFFKWFLLGNIGNMIKPQLFRTYLYYFGVPSVWFDNIWQPFCPDSPGWGFGCSAETLWSSAHAFPVQRKQLNGQSPCNTSARCARPLWNATPFPSMLHWVRCRSGSWQFTWWGFLGNWDTLQQLIRCFCCESCFFEQNYYTKLCQKKWVRVFLSSWSNNPFQLSTFWMGASEWYAPKALGDTATFCIEGWFN